MEFEVRLGRVTEWDVFASGVGGGGGSMSSLCAEHELLRQRWQRHANRLSGAGTRRGEGAWDVTCGGPTVCSLTQNRTSPLSWTGLLPALALTLKKGFLCQRTSCTCRPKRLEVESTPNCGATKCNAHSGSVFIWSPPSFRAPFSLCLLLSLFLTNTISKTGSESLAERTCYLSNAPHSLRCSFYATYRMSLLHTRLSSLATCKCLQPLIRAHNRSGTAWLVLGRDYSSLGPGIILVSDRQHLSPKRTKGIPCLTYSGGAPLPHYVSKSLTQGGLCVSLLLNFFY